jgi:multiple sugar transport system permease protein
VTAGQPGVGQAAAGPAAAVATVRPVETAPQGRGLTRGRVLFVIGLIVFSVLFLFPFVWLLSASLKTRLAYFRFPGRNILFGLVLASMMLPGAVTMVPTFLIWDNIGKVAPPLGVNTLTPLWAMNLFGSAFYIFLQAARVDGANYLTMWRRIAVPLTLPALIVVFIFELKASWTDLMRPLIYLQTTELFTLPRGLKLLVDRFNISSGGEGEMQLVMAGAVIVTLPMIIIFFLGQRYFVEGIATTGRKG